MTSRLQHLVRMRNFLDREILLEMDGGDQDPPPAAGRFIRRAARMYGVTPSAVVSTTKTRNATNARHSAAWMMRQAGMSYPEIGTALNRDHSTVMDSVRIVDSDPARVAALGGVA